MRRASFQAADADVDDKKAAVMMSDPGCACGRKTAKGKSEILDYIEQKMSSLQFCKTDGWPGDAHRVYFHLKPL